MDRAISPGRWGDRRAANAVGVALVGLLFFSTITQVFAQETVRKWAVTAYGAVGTNGGIEDIPGLEADFNDAYLAAVAVSYELARIGGWVAFETEAQLVQHFNKQDHTELNVAIVGRWLKFPWDHYVDTSLAVGDGLSYASSIPTIEKERSPGNNSKFLNYFLVELELKPPEDTPWSFVVRLHHRSGIFGTFDGVSLGSNFLGAGVKYRF